MAVTRREFLKGSVVAGAGLAAGVGMPSIITAQGKEPVKIGVLHSLSGTMAISEVSLRDVVLMAVDEINAKGGVMGRKIQPVVVDPASNWDLFAEKAKQLLLQDKVAVVFGCWTSVSRKSCSSTPCSTKARSAARTSSTPARARTSSSSPAPST